MCFILFDCSLPVSGRSGGGGVGRGGPNEQRGPRSAGPSNYPPRPGGPPNQQPGPPGPHGHGGPPNMSGPPPGMPQGHPGGPQGLPGPGQGPPGHMGPRGPHMGPGGPMQGPPPVQGKPSDSEVDRSALSVWGYSLWGIS